MEGAITPEPGAQGRSDYVSITSGEGLNLKNISSAEANLTTRSLIRVRSGIALLGIARKIHLVHRAAHLSDKAQYNVVGRIVVPEHF